MKKLIVFILLLFGYSSIYSQKERIDLPCATDALHYELMKTKASYKERFEKDNSQWQEHAKKGFGENLQRSVPLTGQVTLTVAFHNMTNNSVAVVDYDQAITNLDAVFNAHNIDFCRAYQDINGNSFNNNVNGPTSLVNSQSAINAFISNVGVIDEFPTERYINIYIVDVIVPASVSGFAYLPSAHGESFDGIYIRRDALFSETLTHEMGHYLGLHHVFGICSPDDIDSLNEPNTDPLYFGEITNPCSCNNDNCLFNGDMICDTPPSMLNKFTCVGNTCHTDNNPIVSDGTHPGFDMDDDKQNFMDYSTCRNHFTDGQFLKMQFAVDPDFGIRKSLLQTQSCSNCPDMNGCSIEIDSFENNSIALDVSGSATINFTSALSCTGTVPPIVSEAWLLTNLDTNSTIASNATLSEYSLTVIGNYSIQVTTTFSVDPLCVKVSTYNFQVVPAFDSSASCFIQMPENDWTNWNRVSYVHGWNRESTYPYNLISLNANPAFAAQRFTQNEVGFDNDGFDIISGTTINDANFNNIPIPTQVSGNVMRVGRIIDINNQGGLNPGDAYFATYTFTPTPENCKFRIYYLGMAEFVTTPISFDSSVIQNSNDTSFGFYSQYQFDSNLSNSTQNAFFGNSEVGGLDYNSTISNPIGFPPTGRVASFFPNYNQLIYGLADTMLNGQFQINNFHTRTVGWQTIDLDYSEFVNSNVDVTLTFFSRSNTGLKGDANKHSYGYFAVECLGGGVPAHLDIDFPDIQIPCSHPNAGTSCYTETFTLPEGNRIPHYYGLVNQPNQPNNIVNLTVTNLTGSGNAVEVLFNYDEQRFEFKICLPSSNVPFEDFQVTFQTLNQTITDTIRVFYGYYYSICETDKGGNYTQNTPKELIYCPDTLQNRIFSLTEPCSIANLIPIPTPTLISSNVPTAPSGNDEFYYQWIVLKDGVPVPSFLYYDAAHSNFNQFVINNVIPFINSNCSYEIYRKFYRKDIYCGGYMEFDSPSFYLYPLITTPVFAVDQVNACANDGAIAINFTGVTIDNCVDPDVLADLNLVSNWNLTFQILDSSGNVLPEDNIEPDSLSVNQGNFVPTTFILNNINPNTNTFIYPAGSHPLHINWTITNFGCNSISYSGQSNVVINVEPSAEGGQIVLENLICPYYTISNVGNTPPASSGFQWQYINSNGVWQTFDTTLSSQPSLSANLGIFGISPLHVRRVSMGIATTANCNQPAYSNELIIQNEYIPQFNDLQEICSGVPFPVLPSNPLGIPYNNQSPFGYWSNWVPSGNNIDGYPTFTATYTVNNNYILCVTPGYEDTITQTLVIYPVGHPNCNCENDLILTVLNNLPASIPSAELFFANETITIVDKYAVVVPNNVDMHAGNFIDIIPIDDQDFINIYTNHHYMAYIEGCPIPRANPLSTENPVIDFSKDLVVYPNPTNGQVTISMRKAKFNKVSIATIDGKIIFEKSIQSTNEFKFDFDRFPQSMYLVSVFADDGEKYFEKVIKN